MNINEVGSSIKSNFTINGRPEGKLNCKKVVLGIIAVAVLVIAIVAALGIFGVFTFGSPILFSAVFLTSTCAIGACLLAINLKNIDKLNPEKPIATKPIKSILKLSQNPDLPKEKVLKKVHIEEDQNTLKFYDILDASNNLFDKEAFTLI